MTVNEPSFYRLFQRSAYYDDQDDYDRSEESVRHREERERFAAAAIAFCLRHSQPFRQHFWRSVCKFDIDSDRAHHISDDGILLEPPHWADLRLVSDINNSRSVCVVEVKAGAPLAARQNPMSLEFVEPGFGYGALFAATEGSKSTQLRYIVLGAREPLPGPFLGDELGIRVQVRSWENVVWNRPHDSLTNDLAASLAELQIEAFVMEEAMSVRIQGGLTRVGEAWKALAGVCAWVGVKRDKATFEAFEAERGSNALGVYVKPPGHRKASMRHDRIARYAGDLPTIAWFGYFSSPVGKVRKELWLYCDSEDTSTKVLERLRKFYRQARLDRDGPAYCVVVQSTAEDKENDFAWFTTAFQRAM